MKQLVFDENCVRVPHDSTFDKEKLYNFVMRCLLLHDGHINKFRLSFRYMDRNPVIDQFLLFLSRKDVKELILDTGVPHPMLPTPSAIFSCQQLTSLNLRGFEVKTPLLFRGFPFLKYLSLEYDIITREVVEILISGCPLLEKFLFANFEHIALSVRAPNLKHLILDGNFEHIYLEHAPLLVAISIEIDTESIPFEYAYFKAADMDFWEKECPADFILKHLKIVKISGVSNKKDLEFIKFVLGRSPVLEMMRVLYHEKHKDHRKKLDVKNKVGQFQRASLQVDIKFFKSSS